jgi:hypothetical protein
MALKVEVVVDGGVHIKEALRRLRWTPVVRQPEPSSKV